MCLIRSVRLAFSIWALSLPLALAAQHQPRLITNPATLDCSCSESDRINASGRVIAFSFFSTESKLSICDFKLTLSALDAEIWAFLNHPQDDQNQPSPATDRSASPSIAGLYQSEPELDSDGDKWGEYIWLYDDGTVIEVTSEWFESCEIAYLTKWFHKPYQSSGTYKVSGSSIEFPIKSPEGTRDYNGRIKGSTLSLDVFSHINGYRHHVTFHLIQAGDDKSDQNQNNCPPRGYFPREIFDDDNKIGLYSKYLKALDEPSLWEQTQNHKVEAYRFLWLRSFHHPLSVRLDVNPDGSALVTTKVLSGQTTIRSPGRLITSRRRRFERGRAENVLKYISERKFWTLPTEIPPVIGADGADWVFEGVKNGTYHVVDRWSPEPGEARSLGLLMLFEVGNLKLLYTEVY